VGDVFGHVTSKVFELSIGIRSLANFRIRIPGEPVDIYSDTGLDRLFPIVVKYSMDAVERSIIKHLQASYLNHDAASLVVIANHLQSKELYQMGISKLVAHSSSPEQADAERMGTSATYEVLTQRYNKKRCYSCGR
jgi:hypothetical protein